MLHITASAYAEALEVDKHTAYRRLHAIPHLNGRHAERFFMVARVLPTIKPRELQYLPKLLAGNGCKPTKAMKQFPHDAEAIATRIEDWIDKRDSQHELSGPGQRIAMVRRAFVTHVVENVKAPAILSRIEHLRKIVILPDRTLDFVLTGNREKFPADFRAWSIRFAEITCEKLASEELAA